ncbi:MAG: hypothetical protein LBF32_01595 [Streptococcaceae bacterium]|nr:hypothetical protein [Streptococcaceae bacterium]
MKMKIKKVISSLFLVIAVCIFLNCTRADVLKVQTLDGEEVEVQVTKMIKTNAEGSFW